jgi:hypothetical protein
MKRPGVAEPAQQISISGGWLLFHFVASVIMRVDSVGEVRSALM